MRLGLPTRHIHAHFADEGLRHADIDAVDPGQVDAADAVQFPAQVKLRCMAAELSPRTFCTFPREFSSVRRRRGSESMAEACRSGATRFKVRRLISWRSATIFRHSSLGRVSAQHGKAEIGCRPIACRVLHAPVTSALLRNSG
jgi:hypothetical protein